MSETPDLVRERETRGTGPGVSVPSAAAPSTAPKPRLTWKTVGSALAPLLLLGAVLLSGLPLCPFRMMTGIPCPGCGLTRATLHALTGDFAGALRFHPLVFVLAPLVGWSILRATLVSAKVIATARARSRPAAASASRRLASP